jgi:hypothetical protein
MSIQTITLNGLKLHVLLSSGYTPGSFYWNGKHPQAAHGPTA